MLEPDGRAALTEQLRPPPGYELLHAIGTTFTLDLTSALSVPLSFAGHRVRESDDPIAILDAVRRAADRVDIFSQAGHIAVPRQASDLVAFLEPMAHPVTASRKGSLFHPKVWVLEFGSGDHRLYRFLCSSRNLTSDRSWDAVVRLDGAATSEAREQSAAVSDFVAALPALTVSPLAGDRARRIAEFAERLERVEWEHPPDVREVVFHALGIGRSRSIDFDGKRHVVISPFLSDDGLADVAPRRSTRIQVVSRAESLERLSPATLERISGYVLDDAARDTSENPDDPLVGLHSKIFVLDRRSGSRVFIGSANATAAAFGGNVEFLVELIGTQSKLGVDAVFGESTALREMTVPYRAVGGAKQTDDEMADYALEVALRSIASARFRATIASHGTNAYQVTIEPLGDVPLNPKHHASVNLLTRPGNSAALPRVPEETVCFADLPLTDITPFLVVHVRDGRGEEVSAVIRADLLGDIPHRRDAILARQIDSPQKFLTFLMLLLALDGSGGDALAEAGSGGFGDWSLGGEGVFEALVGAVGVASGGLDDLARLIDRLRSPEQPTVLPTGFDELWASVWAAHLSIRSR